MDYSTRKSGFTMIELLVTIGIVAILSSVSFISLGTYRKKQNIERTLDEVVAAVQSTQKRSVTQEGGYAWGMRFENNTTSHTYEIFKGSTYASSTSMSKLGLSRALQLMNPYASSTFDALFAPITGALSSKKVISVGTGRNDPYVGDLILNTLGRATKRTEEDVVGYWHFDEGTASTTYDASGGGDNGTLMSSPTWQSEANCKAGKCIAFDGVDYVSVSTIPNVTSALTVEAWAKTSIVTDATYDTIVSKFSSGHYNGWFLRRNANTSVVYFTLYNNSVSTASITGPTIVADQWTHYAATFDGTIARIYVNGVLSASDLSASIGSATTNFVISGNYGSTENWNGSIDEVRLYSRALTATEILNHYNDLK